MARIQLGFSLQFTRAYMRFVSALLLFLFSPYGAFAQQTDQRTISDVLNLRLTKGDLPALTFGRQTRKYVDVTEGCEALLHQFANDPDQWTKDWWLFRTGHSYFWKITS